MTPIPGRPGSFSGNVVYDGTRTGFVSAVLEYLATAPAEVTSVAFEFEGEMIVLTPEHARAAGWAEPGIRSLEPVGTA